MILSDGQIKYYYYYYYYIDNSDDVDIWWQHNAPTFIYKKIAMIMVVSLIDNDNDCLFVTWLTSVWYVLNFNDAYPFSRHVHLGRVVGPGAERQVTLLLVERVVGDVDLTHRLEDAARLPAQ